MSKKGWNGKIEKDEFVQLQESSAEVMGMNALLFNGSNIQEFIDYLKSSLMEKYPNMFFKIVRSPLSNDDELTIYGSLDPKESWSNKIFENSNYFILNVDNKGYMWKTLTNLYRKGMKYHIDGIVKVNFPKQKAKNREDMLRRLTAFIDSADASVNENKVRKENRDSDRGRSEWADLKLAEELFPETATLDRYLHVANMLHATGMYKEEAEALSRARTKLDLKDPEYSKKLDYIKNMEKWNIKAIKGREDADNNDLAEMKNKDFSKFKIRLLEKLKGMSWEDAIRHQIKHHEKNVFSMEDLHKIRKNVLDLTGMNVKMSDMPYIQWCSKQLSSLGKKMENRKVANESQRMATNIDEIKQWFADRGYEISDTVRGKDKNGVYYVIFTRDDIRDEDMPDLRMWENYSVSMGDKHHTFYHIFYIPSEPVDGVVN